MVVVFTALWTVRPVPVEVLHPLGVVWGGAAFWNSPAVPARLHLLTGPASARALALNTSGTCVGVAVGDVVGGVVIDRFGCGPLPVIAAVAGAGALLLFRFAQRSALATTS